MRMKKRLETSPSVVGIHIRIACLLLAGVIVILIGQAGREFEVETAGERMGLQAKAIFR